MTRLLLSASGMTAVMLLTMATMAGQSAPEHQHQHEHASDSPMAELFPVREASGTAWQPDESPMYGRDRMLGQWNLMLDGTAVAARLPPPGTSR